MPGKHRLASLVLTVLILFSLIPFNVAVGQLAYDPWVARPLYVNGRPLDPVNPPSIILGETVRIEIAGVNNGNSDLDEGYLTLSFPDLTSTSSYVVISTWTGPAGNTVLRGPGYRAWAGYGTYQVTLQYWLVEGYAKPWRARQFYTLIVEVKPERVGQFRVHAKMVGKAGNNWYADPTTRGEPKQPQQPGTVILDQQQQEYAYEFVINVLPSKGSLNINVHNIPGLNLPAAGGAIRVDLYTSNRFIGYQYAYFSGGEPYVTVEFQNLDVGNYYMKVTQKPNVGRQLLEFWGISSTEVRAGPPTFFEFYRHTQVITAVNPTKQQCGSLSVGQSITPTVMVKNFDNVGKETEVRLIIDRDRAAPYDYDIWSDTLTIPSGEERGFTLPSLTFTDAGQYYIYAIAYSKYMLEGIDYNPTDQYVWVESCSVGAPSMGVSPTNWSTTVRAGSTAGQTFTITVSGGTALGVTVSRISGPDWISISPASLGDIPPGQSRSFTVTVSPPSGTSGSFSYTIRVSSSNAGSRDIAGTITVSHVAASIVDFRPPTGMYEPGDRLTAGVTVRNTGTVSTIFWIGLSYIKPDGSIFDVPPIQTQSLLPGEQQEVVFSWQLPLDAPVGNYGAVTAIWAGYDQQRNVMIPPKFNERRVDSAFRVERFDFRLMVTPSSVITAPGQSANYVITVERVSGRPRSVSLTISGLPQGVQHTFSQSSGEPTFTSTLNVVTSATTPQGSYTLTITASGGGVTRTALATLVIQSQQDTVAPSVRVIAPNGGETLTVGGMFRIKWDASDNVGVQLIHIFLFQDGSQVLVIARDLQNTGYYDWTVPDRPGTNYRVRIVAVDAAGNAGYDDSDASFSIVQQLTVATAQIGITHTWVGDLRIWLGVQGGREVLIWNREGGSSDNIFREYDLFSLGFTENDLPPSSSKPWYLKVSDEAPMDEGRIEYFRIVYQGQTYESQDRLEIKDFQESIAWIPSGVLPPFDFSLTVSPTHKLVMAGQSVTFEVDVKSILGSSSVSLSVSRLPEGSSGSFDPSFGTPPFSSRLRIITSLSTPPGEYTFTVVGNGGGIIRQVTATLIVLPQDTLLHVKIVDQAISSRNAYFRLETPRYDNVLSAIRDELKPKIGPGLIAIYIHSITVRLEAPRGVQMIVIPLTPRLNIGTKVALFMVDQLVNQIPLLGTIWSFLQLIFDIFSNLDEVKPVNVYEFTDSYPYHSSIDDVIDRLLGRRDKYMIHLKSTERVDWYISFSVNVLYSLDYTGTVVPGYPPLQELTWSRQIIIPITEET
ncbi:MAG: NEW3 domain-containing protein [Candidatus Bathyarchaeia archaeon]